MTKAGDRALNLNEKSNLSDGEMIFDGLLVKNKSGNWILAKNEEDTNAEEIGGCTEFPKINFETKTIEWC